MIAYFFLRVNKFIFCYHDNKLETSATKQKDVIEVTTSTTSILTNQKAVERWRFFVKSDVLFLIFFSLIVSTIDNRILAQNYKERLCDMV